MKIIDTVPYFIKNYEPSLDFLRNYHSRYPDIFHEYFSYHCQNTDERLLASIEKYQHHLESIREGH
ncbi:hypothetical protein [Falsibacillus pallidus]|uniref:Uncharacterized protein n=1 Tax=Falsibacillus pallidus TaxID=493781 RepID=A0A370GPI5_9BACI|nr:hypothetical protein [Falsibacillus pallidus]RDI45597.1 hypothetical protein DFR59_102226 [Falsibacillus pallidus]